MEKMSQQDKKKILKKVYRVFFIYFVVMYLILVFPPIIRLFDRNDIWVGIMPLSQFFILFFVGLVVLGMICLYHIDKKFATKKEKGGEK